MASGLGIALAYLVITTIIINITTTIIIITNIIIIRLAEPYRGGAPDSSLR